MTKRICLRYRLYIDFGDLSFCASLYRADRDGRFITLTVVNAFIECIVRSRLYAYKVR